MKVKASTFRAFSASSLGGSKMCRFCKLWWAVWHHKLLVDFTCFPSLFSDTNIFLSALFTMVFSTHFREPLLQVLLLSWVHGPAFPCPIYSHECQHKLGQTGGKGGVGSFPVFPWAECGGGFVRRRGRTEGGPPQKRKWHVRVRGKIMHGCGGGGGPNIQPVLHGKITGTTKW